MSPPKRTPGNVAKPKGQAMAPEVPEVLPPDGWVKDSPFGFLRYEGGDLARLGDVQAWLEEVKGFDCLQSMAELIKRMPEDVMVCLYYLEPVSVIGKPQNAQLMPPDSTFSHGGGVLPKPVWKSEERRAQTLAMFRTSGAVPPKKTGRAALVGCLEGAVRVQQMGQADPMNNPAKLPARLAVPMTKACQWWGYGQKAAQQAAPAGGVACEWTGERLWRRLEELRNDRHGKHMQRLVDETGINDREIRRRVAPYRPADTKKAGAIGAMARTVVKDGTKTRR